MEGKSRNRLICGCLRLYETDIRQAARNGARDWAALQEMTGIGTGCGNCRVLAERVLRDETARMETEEESARA